MANLWGTFGTGTINVVGGGTSTPTTTATTTTSAGTTSQDRINIGFGPRLNPAPTDTGGFTFTGQPITPAEYQSRKVDFSKEFIDSGLIGLGQQTGISTSSTPEVGEDVQLAITGDDGGDDGDTDLVDIYGTSYSTAFQTTNPLTGEITQNKVESQNRFGYENVGKTDFNSYTDYLKSSGNLDRVSLVENVFDPILGSAPLSDFSFEGFTKTAQQAPAEAGKSLTEALQGRDLAKKGMAAAFTTFTPFPMNMIGGVIGGEVRQNHFGEASLRPSGLGGLLYDASMSAKFGAMSEIRAAYEAHIPGTVEDLGFASKIGGQSVLRRPGANSYLNNTGLSHQQLKNIEAFNKGYMVNTYTFDEQPGKNFFGQERNQKVEDVGGAYAGQGYYTPDGKYYSARYQQVAAAGPASAIRDGARKAGVDPDIFEKAVMDARKGKGTVQDNIKAYKAEKAVADRAATEAAERAEKARRAAEQAAIITTAADYGGSDDNSPAAGASPSSSGPGGGSFSSGAASESTGGMGSQSFGSGWGGMATGGVVGMAAGGAMAAGSSGFIGAPPSQVPEEKTVADDQLTEYPEGTFVINAAAVEEAGESDIIKMLNDAEKEAVRRGIAIDKSGNSAKLIDVAVSQGEVKVAPYLAKVIGYDRLRKINNRGKPEVAERQQEAAQGGMLALNDGGTVTGPASRPFRPDMAQLGDVEYRADLEEYIQNDDLARLGYNLFESGDLEIESVVLPSEESRKITVGVGGMYIPSEGEGFTANRKNPSRNQKLFQRWVEQQQGPNSSDLDKPAAVAFVGKNVNYDRHQAAVTMLHELRHAAISYLEKKYDIPRPPLNFEESMMDAQDYINRIDANKVKSSIPKESDIKNLGLRNKGAYEDTNVRNQLENFQTLAKEELIRERGVPQRQPSIPQEGFFEKGFKSLFN